MTPKLQIRPLRRVLVAWPLAGQVRAKKKTATASSQPRGRPLPIIL